MTTICADETTDLILAEEDHLRGVARRLARCESDADDLVQETLLRAYRARDRFAPGTSVRAWTSTILRRVFLTGAIRAKRRGLQTETDSGGVLDDAASRTSASADAPTPDVKSLADGLEDAVKHALDRVPEVYRTSFFLAVIHDLSCEEIGYQLRVPARTVMSRVHRARERLRGDLAQHRHRLIASASPSRR